MEKSEFGKGLVICLTKFSEHFMKLENDISRNKVMNEKYPDSSFDESNAISLWANGATDHLCEIEVPKAWRRRKIGKLVAELKTQGLLMGHGFTETKWERKDVGKLMDITRQIALLIDKELGLKPDKGMW